jgi:archaellum component FlaC
MPISQREKRRVRYINENMDDLHDSLNDIYEYWVDEDYIGFKKKIRELHNKLKQILNEYREEI